MLPEKIYALRKKNEWSQEQLAERIGVSRQAISKWESGTSTPELEKLIALSECFNISVDELTTDRSLTIEDKNVQSTHTPSSKRMASNLGIGLCLLGGICLILTGLMMVLRPSAAQQINESSMITLNGSGIIFLFCIVLMTTGIVLILRKK